MELMLLRLLGKIQFVLRPFNIDYDVLYSIIETKIKNDKRAKTSLYKKDIDKEPGIFHYIMLIVLLGLVPSISFLMSKDVLVCSSSLILIVMIMLFFSIIQDFSTIILSNKDKVVLSSLPIDSNTLSSVRGIYIMLYLTTMMLSSSIIPAIIGSFVFGIRYLLFIIIVSPFVVMFTMSIAIILYASILKKFDGEKLKDVINVFQIIFTLGTTLVYQIGLTFLANVSKTLEKSYKINYLVSTWFASFAKLIFDGYSNKYLAMFLFGIVLTVSLFYVSFKYLIKSIERDIEKIDKSSGQLKKLKKNRIIEYIIKNPIERSSYYFANAVIKRDRQVKQKMFAGLSSVIIAIAPMLRDVMKGEGVSSGGWFFAAYIIAVFLAPFPQYIIYTSNYKAAYIYEVLPIEDETPIIKGAIKAIVIKFILPILIACILLLSILYKEVGLVDYIVLLLVMTFLCLVYTNTMDVKMPFSVDINSMEANVNNAGCFTYIKEVLINIVLGGAHAFVALGYRSATTIFKIKLFTIAYAALVAILIILNIIYYNKAFNFKSRKFYKGKEAAVHKI